jgi:hypothetical protein
MIDNGETWQSFAVSNVVKTALLIQANLKLFNVLKSATPNIRRSGTNVKMELKAGPQTEVGPEMG